jgi:hypothetical protein
VERDAGEKHSSLFDVIVGDKEKKFVALTVNAEGCRYSLYYAVDVF